MLYVYTWESMTVPTAPPGQFTPVAATLEAALLQGHLDLGQHYGQFDVVRLEVSSQAWATWTAPTPTATRRYRPLKYSAGTLQDALTTSAPLMWICRDSIYRQTPHGQARRLDHRRFYYLFSFTEGGSPATVVVERHRHETTVQLKFNH